MILTLLMILAVAKLAFILADSATPDDAGCPQEPQRPYHW